MAGRKKQDKDKYSERFEFTLTPEQGENFREYCENDEGNLSTFLWLRREIQLLPGVMNGSCPEAMNKPTGSNDEKEIKATGSNSNAPGSNDKKKEVSVVRDYGRKGSSITNKDEVKGPPPCPECGNKRSNRIHIQGAGSGWECVRCERRFKDSEVTVIEDESA